MWDLKKGENIESGIAELQIKAFYTLREKFNPIIISRWRIEFSKPFTSKRYFYEKDFVFDFDDRNFKVPGDYVGGASYVNKVNNYLSSGSEKSIGIFELTGTFEIDPPREFMITKDYDFIPLYPGKIISLETLNNTSLHFCGSLEIQPSDDISEGSLRYAWSFEHRRWQKTVLLVGQAMFYSKPIKLEALTSYLSAEDIKRVQSNPDLLKLSTKGDFSEEEYIEILNKARERYLSEGRTY